MKEVDGNIWDYHDKGEWIVVTTNGDWNKQGLAVMGRGVALDAADKYPMLRVELGKALKHGAGNVVHIWDHFRIITFPVKHHWFKPADLKLIEKSARELQHLCNLWDIDPVYLVEPGTGNGRLLWSEVKPVIAPLLDSRFIVVHGRLL